MGMFGNYNTQRYADRVTWQMKKLEKLMDRVQGYRTMGKEAHFLITELHKAGIKMQDVCIMPDTALTRPEITMNYVWDKEAMDKALTELKERYHFINWYWKRGKHGLVIEYAK